MNFDLPDTDDLPICFGDQEAFPVQVSGVELCLADKRNNGFLVFLSRRTNRNIHNISTCKWKFSVSNFTLP